MKTFEDFQKIARECDIEINGNRDSDIQVRSSEFYKRVVRDGSLGFGEGYVEGLWECNNLSELFYKIARTGYDEVPIPKTPRLLFYILKHKLLNPQSLKRSEKVCQQHYNLGNELYELMLDSELNYSCGYWRNADTLEEAQKAKLDLICRKLYLKPGMKVLDVGCGWGSFARFAARHYGVEVVGINISTEQVNYARKHADDLPIEIRLEDYRKISGEKFDRIISIGMFEHVGVNNYLTYFQ
jgi:cyclopropane-fatty-acyl-phospholipid synthase